MYPFFVSFFICLIITPLVILFANRKGWFDPLDERKIHTIEIPRLGGVGIMAAVISSLFLLMNDADFSHLKLFLLGLWIVFLVGVWDDFQPIPPVFKLLGELIPILLLTYTWQIPLHDLGLVSQQLMWIEFPVTFIFSFWLVNAFNLIDGINGLAGSIGFFSLLVAAYLSNSFSNIICFSFAGALLAFLFFNIMKPKVFMGDGGSLPLGFCLAFGVTQLSSVGKYDYAEPLFLYISAVSIPLFDMFRVFVIRIFYKKNPFKGDKNHLHHLLIELGNSHLKATIILTALSIFCVLMYYLFSQLYIVPLVGILLNIAILMSFTFVVWKKVRSVRRLK